MLALSRALNPECEHLAGDMRTLRLGRVFDAVFVHDAVCYMTTRADLREFIQYVGDFVKFAQDGKRSGKSVDEVAQAWKTPAKYAGYEAMPIPVRVRANVELIFKETK